MNDGRKKKGNKPRENTSNAGIYRFKSNGIVYKFTWKEKKFIDLYIKGLYDPENAPSNAGEAIIEAGYNCYVKDKDGNPTDVIDKKLAWVIASSNLSKMKFAAYITKQLGKLGYTDENVDLQHSLLINQWEDKSVKMRAIEHYDKKMGRMAGQKEEADKNKMEAEKLEKELKNWANNK